MKTHLETASNIAVLVAVVVLLVFFGRQEYERHHNHARPGHASLVGQTIVLPGINLAPESRTLLLAICTTCHFCKDSESFYRQLAKINRGQIKIVAVLPQQFAEAQNYVQTSIAPSIQVVSSRLDSIGVTGTPTVLLLDGAGQVQHAWVGTLSEQDQKEVRALLM